MSTSIRRRWRSVSGTANEIYRTVYHTIAMALANRELIPAVSLENEKDAEKELKIQGLEKCFAGLPTRKMEATRAAVRP